MQRLNCVVYFTFDTSHIRYDAGGLHNSLQPGEIRNVCTHRSAQKDIIALCKLHILSFALPVNYSVSKCGVEYCLSGIVSDQRKLRVKFAHSPGN